MYDEDGKVYHARIEHGEYAKEWTLCRRCGRLVRKYVTKELPDHVRTPEEESEWGFERAYGEIR